MQSDWLNSALSPVVYGDIALSIKVNMQNTHKYIRSFISWYKFECLLTSNLVFGPKE